MSAGLGSIISTWPPSPLSRSPISAASLSSPSRSPLPDSIETRSFSVSRSGAFSLPASDRTGSSGAADALVASEAPGIARAARIKQRQILDLFIIASVPGNENPDLFEPAPADGSNAERHRAPFQFL